MAAWDDRITWRAREQAWNTRLAKPRVRRVWQCVCGQFNSTDDKTCIRCGRERRV
jgi:hypothetical protein